MLVLGMRFHQHALLGPLAVGLASAGEQYRPKYTASGELGGECRIKDFEIDGKPLKRGGHGDIFKAKHRPTGRVVALKHIKGLALTMSAKYLANEEQFQHDLSHDNIAKIYCAMMPSPENVYFVMPYYPNGDLQRYIEANHLSKERAAEYIGQLLRAIHHVHSQFIVHLDIKPQNVLIAHEGQLKLTDFGIAARSTHDDQVDVRGPMPWRAPEIVRGREFGRPADYYSLAVTVWSMFQRGKLPFTAEGLESGPMEWPTCGDTNADKLVEILATRDPGLRWEKAYLGFDRLRGLELFRGTSFYKSSSGKGVPRGEQTEPRGPRQGSLKEKSPKPLPPSDAQSPLATRPGGHGPDNPKQSLGDAFYRMQVVGPVLGLLGSILIILLIYSMLYRRMKRSQTASGSVSHGQQLNGSSV